MKYFYWLIVIVLFVSGCDTFQADSNQAEIKKIDVVSVELKSGEEFIYNIGFLGDEEQALIKDDSQYANVSKLNREFDASESVIYRYQSKTDFTGRDTVVLEVRRGSDGASPNKNIYLTVLQFNIQLFPKT